MLHHDNSFHIRIEYLDGNQNEYRLTRNRAYWWHTVYVDVEGDKRIQVEKSSTRSHAVGWISKVIQHGRSRVVAIRNNRVRVLSRGE